MSPLDPRRRSLDWDSARRQFRLSLLLVAALVFAALALGSALPLRASPQPAPDAAADRPARFGRLATLQD